MKDLSDVVKAQKIETIRKDGRFRLLGILVVVVLFYFAVHFVRGDFQVLTFLNPLSRSILHPVNELLLTLSNLIRQLLS